MRIKTDVIERAIQVAIEAHQGQNRKGTDMPYITHPLAVGIILAKAGADDQVVAGILHDTVEDTMLSLADIEENFGRRIAGLVEAASEPDKSLPWKERKEHTIAYLKTAPLDVRTLACADKLHNIRSIKRDHDAIGDELWSRFNHGKADQEWYYRNVVESLGVNDGFKLLEQLRSGVDEVFGSTSADMRKNPL
ncbi:HD domain-containing protein [Alicyclobacillus tolerans]|uniref:HD domain-containing protein n=1 Tax=Alicyclobacillus tolerans TaxID=90970 RepID=UPI001F385011|nr:HD domain-containing protein [Alicyclobacillus tolerans]MCF8565742.1 HD domain-containing protein [Alicyclobacillus tolerans]